MPPTINNKALPNPTQCFIFNFLIISLISIENKCLYDAIRYLKREKIKDGIEPGSIASKDILARDLPSELLKLMCYIDSTVVSVIPPLYLD